MNLLDKSTPMLAKDFAAFLARAQKANKLIWLHFRAPWSFESRSWDQETLSQPAIIAAQKQFSYFAINASLWPELDNAAQVLAQSLSGKASGWPLHLFIEPRSMKPVVGVPALETTSFLNFLRDLLLSYQIDPSELKSQAEQNAATARTRDPMQSAIEKSTGDGISAVSTSVTNTLDTSFLTPLVQSLDPATGLFGTQTTFLFAGAYGALLDHSIESPNLGEIGLSQLCRGPLYDVVGGGFFRAYDIQANRVSGEKLLHQNAEMLWVLCDAWQLTRSPHLEQVIGETVRCIAEDFYNVSSATFWGALTSTPTRNSFQASDLLECLDGNERLAAQKFFGVSAVPTVPRIREELGSLGKELGIAPIDLKNVLISAQKKMRLFRNLKSGLGFIPAADWQLHFTLATLYRSLRLMPSLVQSGLSQKIETVFEMQLPLLRELIADESLQNSREAACAILLISEYQRATSSFEFSALIESKIKMLSQKLSLSDELPIFGERLALYDHLGFSRFTLQLLAIESATANSSQSSADQHMARTNQLSQKISQALMATRRLGLNAMSVFWASQKIMPSERQEIPLSSSVLDSDVFQ